MSMEPLQVWFEFASTYSYLSVSRIEELTAPEGIPLDWKVFLLGPIFKSQGWSTSLFNIYEAKGRYMWRDIERLCEKYEIPFKKPTQFPRNGLLAARLTRLISSETWCTDFIRAVFRANFFEDRDISNPKIIGAILHSLGHNARPLIEKSLSAENKERLKRQTEKAQSLGIFGAPSFLVDKELFWGNDRLDDAIAYYITRT